MPFLEGQGSLLCGSIAAFILAAVTESWGWSPDLGLSANILGAKGWTSSTSALLTALQLPWSWLLASWGCCPGLETCMSTPEWLRKCRPSPELGPVCTPLPLAPQLGPHPGAREQLWASWLCGGSCCGDGTETAAAALTAPSLHVSVPRRTESWGCPQQGRPAAAHQQPLW